jgi:hypothetical protein
MAPDELTAFRGEQSGARLAAREMLDEALNRRVWRGDHRLKRPLRLRAECHQPLLTLSFIWLFERALAILDPAAHEIAPARHLAVVFLCKLALTLGDRPKRDPVAGALALPGERHR